MRFSILTVEYLLFTDLVKTGYLVKSGAYFPSQSPRRNTDEYSENRRVAAAA